MRALRRAAASVAGLALAACSSAVFAPQPVPSAGTPYAGLDENSYGVRSVAALRDCSGGGGPGRLAALSSLAAAPAQGLMKVDATLQRLGLADPFREPTGRAHPPVSVLSHGPDSIVFWHAAGKVPLSEVTEAARAWCRRHGRGLLYRGSASRCSEPERSLSGAAVLHTYAISAYACTGRP